MFHYYTFGRKSKQFLILTPKQADLVNRFTNSFFLAQENFLKENNRRWDPAVLNEPISIPMGRSDLIRDREEMDEYNRLTKILNLQHKIRNRMFTLFRVDVSNEDIDDFLIKRF